MGLLNLFTKNSSQSEEYYMKTFDDQFEIKVFIGCRYESSFVVRIKPIKRKRVIIHKRASDDDESLKKTNENFEYVITLSLEESNLYSTVVKRLVREYPTSHDQEIYDEQRLAFDRLKTILANYVVMTTLSAFEREGVSTRKFYLSDEIKTYTSDIKKLLTLFARKCLIQQMRNNFFDKVKVLNRETDLKYYASAVCDYQVLAIDNDIKNSQANNLYLVRTNLCFDTAQTSMIGKIRDPDIQKKISSQHKNPLSKENIIEI